jgi:Fe-Mn family superoxide dismutase
MLQTTGLAGAVLVVGRIHARVDSGHGETKLSYPYSLPKLPYAFDALEPAIDAETMMIHHDRHHQAYVDKLNDALAQQPSLQEKTLEQLLRSLDQVPESIRMAVRNNGGGHLNHTMFWNMMAKNGGKPSAELTKAIDASFGSFDKFKEAMTKAAETRFGSGWAWLVSDNGKLAVVSTPNQDTPVMEGKVPLLGLDVWEHAYYLTYRNKRPEYVKAWWDIVNWADVSSRFAAARAASKGA